MARRTARRNRRRPRSAKRALHQQLGRAIAKAGRQAAAPRRLGARGAQGAETRASDASSAARCHRRDGLSAGQPAASRCGAPALARARCQGAARGGRKAPRRNEEGVAPSGAGLARTETAPRTTAGTRASCCIGRPACEGYEARSSPCCRTVERGAPRPTSRCAAGSSGSTARGEKLRPRRSGRMRRDAARVAQADQVSAPGIGGPRAGRRRHREAREMRGVDRRRAR